MAPPTNEALRNLCFAHPIFRERYQGWEEVGSGAFATVVKTHCVDRGETVAVKVFQHLGDEDDRRRFRAEVANAQRVVSSLLVRTYSPFDQAGLRWIEMEYVDGTNLEDELKRREAANEPFPLPEALEIAICVTEALATAHREQVVHRDLKPANILLRRSGQPIAKLADFGISRYAGAEKLTGTGAFPGTPKFGSPEGFAGEPLGPPHDVYSLGLCLYLLFTNNRFPFQIPDGCSLEQLVSIHTRRTPFPARTFVPALDPALDTLLARCLEKKPAKRPTVEDVLAELKAVRSGQASPRASSAAGSPRRAWAMAIAGVFGVGIAALALRPGTRQPERTVTPTLEQSNRVSVPVSSPAKIPGRQLEPQRAPLRASLQGDFLQVQNEGRPLQAVTLRLVDVSGTVHVASIAGGLGEDETSFVPLDSFAPPASARAPVKELQVAAHNGKGTVEATVPVE